MPQRLLVCFVSLGLACTTPIPEPTDDVDIYELAPSVSEGAPPEDPTSGPPIAWEGPEATPVPGRAWGGMAVYFGPMDCTLWWTLEGDEISCGDCELGFELEATLLDDSCGGLGVSDLDLQIEVFDGRAYAFSSYWGEAAIGGGLFTWDGYSDSYYSYSYRYYGYIHYP